MILDYTSYKYADHVVTPYSNGHAKNELFLGKRGWCPFCKIEAAQVHLENSYPGGNTLSNFSNEIWACLNCGWWEQLKHYSNVTWLGEQLRHAILRKYNIEDKEIPISTLNKYLKNNPNLIFNIHSTKMELLVQSIFSSFYNCEVHHCGKSHDGGIDLYYINSDTSTAIQVKRRQSDKVSEPVSSIRELLGATILSNFDSSVFVTTAKKFSTEAKKAAEKAVKLEIVSSFTLFDFNRFVSMLKLATKENVHPWTKFVDEHFYGS